MNLLVLGVGEGSLNEQVTERTIFEEVELKIVWNFKISDVIASCISVKDCDDLKFAINIGTF